MTKIKLHLPNGNTYFLDTKVDIIEDAQLEAILNLFGKSDRLYVEVQNEENKDSKKVLVLWGDTLKNSYISIEN
jgi:hypothetical protein